MLLLLLAVNVACFVPHYLLNFRERPNPFQFLRPTHPRDSRGIKLFYTKLPFSDPLRINFDFTVSVLIASFMGWEGTIAQAALGALLVFGIVEIGYTSLMQTVFKRPPVLGSDLALLRTGLTIVRGRIAGALIATLLLFALLCWAAFAVTGALLRLAEPGNPLALCAAVALLPSCLYHLRRYPYQKVIYRTVYSPTLHFLRNLEVGGAYRLLIERDRPYFEAMNRFDTLTLSEPPNVVMVCIESYGGIVHTDPAVSARLAPHLEQLETQVQAAGLAVASTLSEAPLFTGGSWLSYTTFTYGFRIDDLVVHDRLFAPDSAFTAYDSLFHVFRRNGYRNYLLCPLGGVPDYEVDWKRIERNFQCDVMIDFESLGYAGPRLPYMGLDHRYAPPDQFALNAAYERAAADPDQPFSLFFLTLNSHYPYDSPLEISADWRTLDQPAAPLRRSSEPGTDSTSRYVAAMGYQLDMIARFLAERGGDNTVFIVFGDHQPPFVATDDMGMATPVHVVSSNAGLVQRFVEAGYAASLRATEGTLTRHEAFMPVFLSAMQAEYGDHAGPPIAAGASSLRA